MLKLPAELTHDQVNACLAGLSAAVSVQDGPVNVDASALSRFDSSALAMLLELRRVCLRTSKPMVVQGVPARLRDLAALYGVEGLLLSA